VCDRDWFDLWWCEAPVLAADAMDDWLAMLRACDPWRAMFLDDVGGEFHAVLRALFQSGDGLTPDVRAARLRRAAREHGAFRRRQGAPALVFADEIAFAEEAIACALMRTGASPALVTTVHDSLVPVLRAVERATYTGYVDWGERYDADG